MSPKAEKSSATDNSESSTSTIGWTLRKGLAVEVYISPDYAKKVDAAAELKKIAEGIEPVK